MSQAAAGFVGFDPDEVDRLVRQLTGATDEIRRQAARAQAAVDRVAPVIPTADVQREVDFLRSIGMTVGSMRDEVGRRLVLIRAEAIDSAAGWGQRSLSGVSESVEDHLKRADRWVPGHWVGGEWMPGHWRTVERRVLHRLDDGAEVRVRIREGVKVPGRFREHTWIEGRLAPDEALRTGGKWLGRSMNALDVGLAGWGEWGARRDLSGVERAAHAGLAGVTVGGGSAVGGWLGYGVGVAAAGMLVGAAPVLVPVAGAVAVVGGIAGAMAGSELGGLFGKGFKSGAKAVGRKIAGWFS